MFDYMRCEHPLPDGWRPTAGALQTKDFGCELLEVVISKDGRLLVDRGHYEDVPVHERRYPNAKPDTWEWFCGCVRRVQKHEDANFHGMVNFYGYDDRHDWHNYNAKFSDGQLVHIKRASEL